MNKSFLKLILLGLIIILGNSFFLSPAYAAGGLNLATTQECSFKYSGDNCIGKLKAFNNTDYILEGIALLHIKYQGECNNNQEVNFDGEGIEARFSIIDNNWLNFSGWENGTTAVSGFEIAKGETHPKLEIKTHPALCPGEYTFTLTMKGTAEEEYTTSPIVVGGGGGYVYIPPATPITDTRKVTATPGEGGITSLTNPDGSKIKLTVPPGAVSTNTRFIIEPVDINTVNQPDPTRGLFLINGLIYSIRAEANGIPVTKFNKPITLTFTYTNKQIEGLDETSLKIYYWGKTQNQWVALENSKVNTDNNTVTASTSHLTIFALIGSKIEFVQKEDKKEKAPAKETGVPERIKEIPKKITKKIKKITEEIIPSVLGTETEKSVPKEKTGSSENVTTPGERAPQRGLAPLTSTGMVWEEINKYASLIILVTLCLLALILIGAREWKLFRKKRKK